MEVQTNGSANVVPKGEFARMCNVSAGRVSQWISDGKIGPDALVGEGRGAQIKVDEARAQLSKNLDISQQLGNGATTDLGGSDGATETIEDQLRRQKLRQAELATQRAEEEARIRAGRYVDAAVARQQYSKIAGTVLSAVEGGLTDFATAIAAKFEVPQRDVIHLLRQEFRKLRETTANRLRDQATELSDMIDD